MSQFEIEVYASDDFRINCYKWVGGLGVGGGSALCSMSPGGATAMHGPAQQRPYDEPA
jgi:hypothetical protein